MVTWSDSTIETGQAASLPVRIYRGDSPARTAPLVFHLHGGAFCGGSPATCATVPELLAKAGAVVVSADYPLAPAHPFPHALKQLSAALNVVAKSRSKWTGKTARLYLAGEEAGGNLAASLALVARDQFTPLIAGQILLSPMLDPCLGTTSISNANMGVADCKLAEGWHSYLGSADRAGHPYAAPLEATRLAGLPPALIVTAQDDPLRDEGLRYAARLAEAGVSVRRLVLPAPTAWPEILCDADCSAAAWADSLRAQFIQFFGEHAASTGRGDAHRSSLPI